MLTDILGRVDESGYAMTIYYFCISITSIQNKILVKVV